MIQYCPLEEEPKVTYQETKQIVYDPDIETECNYLVMFFIIGVLVLAITDKIGIR